MSRNPIDLRKGVTTCEVLSPYYLTSLNMRSTIPAKIRHVNLLFSPVTKNFFPVRKKIPPLYPPPIRKQDFHLLRRFPLLIFANYI